MKFLVTQNLLGLLEIGIGQVVMYSPNFQYWRYTRDGIMVMGQV